MTVTAPFRKRVYVVYLALRFIPYSWSAWGFTVLFNYLFYGLIVEMEEF
jgi:hypothetical protein